MHAQSWPAYGKIVHTTTDVLYMNTISYLVANAKKPRKQRKLNVAYEENSDASKPQDKLQIESKSSISNSSKINIKAKKIRPTTATEEQDTNRSH